MPKNVSLELLMQFRRNNTYGRSINPTLYANLARHSQPVGHSLPSERVSERRTGILDLVDFAQRLTGLPLVDCSPCAAPSYSTRM